MAAGGRLLECLKQGLLMVAAQPCGPTCADQLPNQIHAVGNGWASVDHITAEDQVVLERENRQQIDQCFVAAVNITNDPVVCLCHRHCHEQSPLILKDAAALVSGNGYCGLHS